LSQRPPLAVPPLAVYVHWPYCARVCPYCDFNVVRDRGQTEQAGLADAIVRDLEGQADLTGERRLVSIFFGGGTPSLMRPEWATRVIETARRLWTPAERVEITLEANPTDAEAGRFAAFVDAGVNRLSLGVQSFDDAALKFLGRNHNADEARRAAGLARAAFEQLSLDLIYALPDQTPSAWSAQIDAALGFEPDHISPYQLTIESGAAFGRAAARGTLVPSSVDAGADLYEITQTRLGDAGFEAYEVSNHAQGPGARSRHNLAYWRGEDYVGAGPGAHGRITIGGGRVATEAARGVKAYIEAVNATGLGFAGRETLSPRQAALERLLMGLRTHEGVCWRDLAPLGLTPESTTTASLARLGLIEAGETRLCATAVGRPLLDRVVAELADG
jgi:putative oxygen-independent coproporphyrinogen III oxidase